MIIQDCGGARNARKGYKQDDMAGCSEPGSGRNHVNGTNWHPNSIPEGTKENSGLHPEKFPEELPISMDFTAFSLSRLYPIISWSKGLPQILY